MLYNKKVGPCMRGISLPNFSLMKNVRTHLVQISPQHKGSIRCYTAGKKTRPNSFFMVPVYAHVLKHYVHTGLKYSLSTELSLNTLCLRYSYTIEPAPLFVLKKIWPEKKGSGKKIHSVLAALSPATLAAQSNIQHTHR